MGTYQILAALWKHWSHPVNPVYRADSRYGPPWRAINLEHWTGRVVRAGVALFILVLLVTAARIIINQSFVWILSNVVMQAACLSGGSLLLIALAALTFLWPIAVAVAASGAIVRDREHRTWAALLTTPLDWNELLTAKLASSLQWLNRPGEMLFWVQGILLAVVFILVIGRVSHSSEFGSPLLAIIVAVLASVQFAIARAQDYATASVIGLAASMFSATRQTASVTALMGGVALVVARLFLTAILLLNIPLNSPQAVLVMLCTGPTTAVVLSFPLPMITALLILIPLLREYTIRTSYRWILNHLGAAAGNG